MGRGGGAEGKGGEEEEGEGEKGTPRGEGHSAGVLEAFRAVLWGRRAAKSGESWRKEGGRRVGGNFNVIAVTSSFNYQ